MDDKNLSVDTDIKEAKEVLRNLLYKRYPVGLKIESVVCKRWGLKPYVIVEHRNGALVVERIGRLSSSSGKKQLRFDPAKHPHKLLNEIESGIL